MIGKIGFEKLEITCIIGELAFEREAEQVIYVSLEVIMDFSDCVKDDCINKTIDYVKLSEICIAIAKKGKYNLIETCGSEILKYIITDSRVIKSKIRIEKPAAIEAAKCAYIELEMSI